MCSDARGIPPEGTEITITIKIKITIKITNVRRSRERGRFGRN